MENKVTQIAELKKIIKEFDDITWERMATPTDLARFIVVNKGFCPSSDSLKQKVEIAKLIRDINDVLEENEMCGLSLAETQKVIERLKEIQRGS